MFKDLNWLRLTPDRDGRGGTKTGIHTFQQTPVNDVRQLSNFHVYKGAWRRDYETLTYPSPIFQDAGATACPAVHGYIYPSLTDPAAAPSIKIIGQTLLPAVSHFWDFSSGTVRSLRPVQPAIPQAAVFKNINQRCFGGDGLAEAVIMDDRTPAIHAQPNQRLGIATPTQPLSINTTGNVTAYGSGYIHGGSYYLNHPNPDNPLQSCIAGDTVTITPPNATVTASGWQGFAPQPAPYVLTLPAVTSNTTVFTVTGTISITTGTSIITLGGGGAWPINRQFAGLAINFNGYSYVILTHGYAGDVLGNYDINGNLVGVIPPLQLYILGVYDGPSLVGVPYTITGVQVTLAPPPALPSLAQYLNTGLLGYSQSTNARLFQVKVECARANGYFRNLGNISLGVPAADSSISGGAILTITDAFMKDGKKNVASASQPFTIGDVGSPFFIDRAGYAGAVLSSVVEAFIDDAHVRLAAPNESGLDLGPGINAWWGADPIIHDGTIAVPGTPNTLTSASNPFVPGDVGKTIVIEGAGPPSGGDPTSLITTISGYGGPSNVTLTAAATTGVSTARCWWRGISVDTHAGPTYAYAWYDPETGHMSNISPLAQVPRPKNIGAFTDFANITPAFQIDPGYISYPDGTVVTGTITPGTPTSDAVRFSHIMFFRTLSTPGSSTLYPIGSLMPFVGKVHPGNPSSRGSWSPNLYRGWMGLPNNYAYAPAGVGSPNYWYDFSSDSDLLLSGGFRAPQFTNEKPMALLRGGISQPGYPYQIAYWDRRCWIVDTQDPDKILFSCDDAQCPLGVPEESFPPTNFLRLPSEDGQVTGMRTVGDLLLVTTNRLAYIIAGNNESNYRLMKISSSMPGVGTYQMSEFPTNTGAEGEPATLFFLGRDRILYQWMLGGTLNPISSAVQDQFDTALSGLNPMAFYKAARIHALSAWGRRLVVASIAPSSQSVLVYDIDNKIWNSTGISDSLGVPFSSPPISMTTVYGGNVPVNEIYAVFSTNLGVNAVVVESWMRDDTANALPNPSITTFPLQFDGKKIRRQICMVNIHATAGTWRLTTIVDESTVIAPTVPFAAYPNPLFSIYGPAPNPVDGATVQDGVVMTAAFNPDGMPVIGYRFTFRIDRLDNSLGQIFAIDIGYKDVESPGDGDA